MAIGFLGALGIGLASSLLSGALSSSSAKSSQESNFDYNTEVLQNRHQWEVKDLENAGLNPILSATGSSGGSGVTSSSAVDYQSSAHNAIANAMSLSKLGSEIKNIQSSTAKNESDVALNEKNIDNLAISMINSAKDGLIKDEELNRLKVITQQAQETLKQMKLDTRDKQDKRDIKNSYGNDTVGKFIGRVLEKYTME